MIALVGIRRFEQVLLLFADDQFKAFAVLDVNNVHLYLALLSMFDYWKRNLELHGAIALAKPMQREDSQVGSERLLESDAAEIRVVSFDDAGVEVQLALYERLLRHSCPQLHIECKSLILIDRVQNFNKLNLRYNQFCQKL